MVLAEDGAIDHKRELELNDEKHGKSNVANEPYGAQDVMMLAWYNVARYPDAEAGQAQSTQRCGLSFGAITPEMQRRNNDAQVEE